MQALKLKPSSGWNWIRSGWRLFRRQPLAFTAVLFFYWLLLLSASAVIGWIAHGLGLLLPFASADLIAGFGSVLIAMFTPALTVGFMQACRSTDAGGPVHPMLLFAPLRSGRKTLRSLLMLGAIQTAALVCIVFLTSGFDAPQLQEPAASTTPSQGAASGSAAPQATDQSVPSAVRAPVGPADQEAVRREATARAIQGLAYLPVALLMWYAPMLATWHGLPAGKALFFSVVAVWRNLGAFFVYGLGWLAIWMSCSFAILLISSLVGNPNFAAVLALPLVMLVLTWMYCSVYPSYATVFVDAPAAALSATPPADRVL